MNIVNLKDWGLGFKSPNEKPFVISGPCSAESEQQVLNSCLALSNIPQVQMLRAGIWKPRTRPNSFEGMGEQALPWLKLAGRTTGLPICIEVASPHHVELALKHGVDVLWIGARSTVNPFAVQAIADALKGVDIPVMVKNPVNPDLDLWIGALERLHNAGIQKLAAIHRGFSVYGNKKYRNSPLWEIPIELSRRIRNIEIICDPSHIGGDASVLLEIAQKAMYLGFDGLMLESHCQPEIALSDAKQQITAAQLTILLEELIIPKTAISDPIFLNKLEELRNSIDKIDYQMLGLLSKRMELVREIGDYKKENNLTILQIERWAEIFKTRVATSESLELGEQFITDLIQAIHKESIRQQSQILQNEPIPKKVDNKNGFSV